MPVALYPVSSASDTLLNNSIVYAENILQSISQDSNIAILS